ncbi:hypothetical protein [Persicobacter sp. CCB-QB2]|uniref:hypothetical protein n=1 Tax=Persicobacter sp. CCB-QB2 TaxID=1561025 RepID=UPI001C103DFA|nr:hypothetical protein [Persicobacter sp. CCB-QB2]
MAKLVMGSDFRDTGGTEEEGKYWDNKYRVEALVALRSLMDATMTKSTFEAITQPTFVGYYYKDKDHQDETVSVASILKMYEELGTPEGKKVKQAFPEAGDHVIGTYLQ